MEGLHLDTMPIINNKRQANEDMDMSVVLLCIVIPTLPHDKDPGDEETLSTPPDDNRIIKLLCLLRLGIRLHLLYLFHQYDTLT